MDMRVPGGERVAPSFTFELEAVAEGWGLVCGVDEAGRGPLAGPVVAAAVVLPLHCSIEGLKDSKLVSAPKRDLLYEAVCQEAIAVSVGMATVQEIDVLNILRATHEAMRRALRGLRPAADFAIVDGLPVTGLGLPHRAVIKGDRLCCSVAAASIIAKVTRDRFMLMMDESYPGYGFAKHKGYGTREHVDAIGRLGQCPIHRLSFRVPRQGERDGSTPGSDLPS